uniref:Uncharacterized protein n=1 Tax=Anguilla anguilla TaxID=7936 RepID=A0A0E9TI49_ANGAN
MQGSPAYGGGNYADSMHSTGPSMYTLKITCLTPV